LRKQIRSILYENTGGNYINFSELEVFDTSGSNIALSGTATASSTYNPSCGASRANDGFKGIVSPLCETYFNGFVSGGSATSEWWKLQLGAPSFVLSLSFYNRPDNVGAGWPARTNGDKLILYDPANQPIGSCLLRAITTVQQFVVAPDGSCTIV
jgi:hypothetical protein